MATLANLLKCGPVFFFINSAISMINELEISRLVSEAGQAGLSTTCPKNSDKLSLIVRKPVFGVLDQVPHNPAVQPLKMARGLKFWV